MPFTEALKLKVKRKSHFSCCLCKTVGVEVHHIIPQEEGGPDAIDNAAPLCPSCHEIYGANPTKRKFIKEARDFWYEICSERYASDPDRIDELKSLLKKTVSYNDFQKFKEELMDLLPGGYDLPRNKEEVISAVDEFFDKVWYDRHQMLMSTGKIGSDKGVIKDAELAARKIEERYLNKELGPWDDFQWGMINGKLSALRWVLGDDWDMLDT